MKRLLIVLCASSALVVTGAAVALAGGATRGGTVHVYGVNNGGETTNIIITGAFAASGPSRMVGTSIQQVTTSTGTFKVDTSKLDNAPGTGGVNQDSCSGAFMVSEPVTLVDGTGAYEGISGTLQIKETFAAILPTTSSAKCREDANPTSDVAFFQGDGTVSFK
jgi:hypothetical protein